MNPEQQLEILVNFTSHIALVIAPITFLIGAGVFMSVENKPETKWVRRSGLAMMFLSIFVLASSIIKLA